MSSQPEPGLYHIISPVPSETSGDKLAMKFNGDNQPITVTPLLDYSNPAQHWILENFNELKCIIPRNNPDLKANWYESAIYTWAGGHPCWDIVAEQGYYFIQGGSSFWSIQNALNGALILTSHDKTGEKQRWIFSKVAPN
ncbi:hypothetical protein FRC12_001709 [Ceratobasidium sp. 428]|nr:hypothetical protein FRC12_001709 [Ceratobasidium sp. 428]